MLDYTTRDVWARINEGSIEAHEAYQRGCDRLGCVCCIFAQECGKSAKDVKINCANNPELYEELDRLEIDTGFTMSISGVRVRDLVKKG
jgi:3'-phosphoadenosine 5'-phosphosulfate sulfotransferase (PAPS reductase)/FAD synthetase